MSKVVATLVIRGAKKIVKEAEDFLNKAVKEKQEAQKLEFPETAFYLPMANALLGVQVKTLKDARPVLEHARSLLPGEPSENLWLPYLGNALDAGIATLLAEEIIMALRYLYGQEPQKDCNGFFTDTIIRFLGIQLVDGRMPGAAAILGAAPDNKTAVEIIRQLQQRNILIFVGSNVGGRSIIDQLIEEDVQMGWDNYIVPYGRDTISAIYPLNWAIRAALTFGGLKAGQAKKCLLYTKERVFAFGLVLGEVDDLKYATGAGAINMGFPIVADTQIPEVKPSGITTYEALIKELDHKKIVARAIEVRGLKLTVTQIPIPVPYAAAFEGERVRREQLCVELGGKASTSFEYLTTKKSEEVEDGKVELIGSDIDKLENGQKSLPLAIIVEVYGRKMQKDFEPILERQIHRFTNYAMGLMHIGQRDMNWIRISKDAFNKGFRLKHIGIILHAMLHQEYSAIVDKVQVKIYTKLSDVEKLLPQAKKVFDERDERSSGMIDESVDTFYSCTLCVPKGENIVFADGSFTSIENLIETVVNTKDINILSLNGTDLCSKSVGEIFINPAPQELIKIILSNGNSIVLTKNHRILVDSKEGLDWKKAQELKLSDYLLVPRKTSLTSINQTYNSNGSLYLIELLSDATKIYDRKFILWLKNQLKLKYKSFKKAAKQIGFRYTRLIHGLHNSSTNSRGLTISETKLILKFLGVNWEEVKHKICEVGGMMRNISLRKLTVDGDFMYLLGLVAADGTIRYDRRRCNFPSEVVFTNSEPEIVRRFSQIIYDFFGQELKIKNKLRRESRYRKTEMVRVYGPVVGSIAVNLGIRAKKGEKYRLDKISQFAPNLIAMFLRGLFDGDGHVTKINLGISTKNYNEARDIYLLMKKIGISTTIMKATGCYQVCTSNRYEFNKFSFLISSYHPLKKRLIREARFKSDKYHVVRTETVPWNCGNLIDHLISKYNIVKSKQTIDRGTIYDWMIKKHRISKEKLNLFLNKISSQVSLNDSVFQDLLRWCQSQITFEKVKKVEVIKYNEKEVYNFSVADTHNYLVNGIVVKNCQSFAPNHVCIVTPERLGLCGAFSWLDTRASFEIIPTGPNQPVLKGQMLDEKLGQWKNINDFVYQKSNKAIEKVSMYSLMDSPQSSCGCFECIVAIIPEANGFMIVNRDYPGMTPSGMTFTTLAGSVGGGVQTPGFLGVGKLYIVSKKFISAEGGLKRLVWMPRELKELLGDRLKKRVKDLGEPDLIDKIADETQATTQEELLSFLRKVNHPALEMPPIL